MWLQNWSWRCRFCTCKLKIILLWSLKSEKHVSSLWLIIFRSTVPGVQDKLDNISKGVNELVIEHGGRSCRLQTPRQFLQNWKPPDEKRKSILKWLTSIDCNSKQEEILSKRERGTGIWLFEDTRFKDWLCGRSQFLLGLGGREYC